jgi:hypothetical protein
MFKLSFIELLIIIVISISYILVMKKMLVRLIKFLALANKSNLISAKITGFISKLNSENRKVYLLKVKVDRFGEFELPHHPYFNTSIFEIGQKIDIYLDRDNNQESIIVQSNLIFMWSLLSVFFAISPLIAYFIIQ